MMDQSRQWPNPPPKRQRLPSEPEATFWTPVNDGSWINPRKNVPDNSVSGFELSANTQNHMLDHSQPSSIAFHAPTNVNDAYRRIQDQGNLQHKGMTAFRPVLPDLRGNITAMSDVLGSDIIYGTSLGFQTPESASQAGWPYTGRAQLPLETPQYCRFQSVLPAQNFFECGFRYPSSVLCEVPLDVRNYTPGTPSQVVDATEEFTNVSQHSTTSLQCGTEIEAENFNSAEKVCFGMV